MVMPAVAAKATAEAEDDGYAEGNDIFDDSGNRGGSGICSSDGCGDGTGVVTYTT